MFSDVRNFTALSEDRTPQDVVALIRRIHTPATEAVLRHGGTLDKFIGDGVMAFFGAPQPLPEPCAPALAAARDLLARVARLNDALEAQGEKPIDVGIGLHVGDAVVGNMGSARRLSYTALGSSVNLAQRLEANAPVGGILIAERTHEQLGGALPTQRRGPIQVKGIDEPQVVYEVILETERNEP